MIMWEEIRTHKKAIKYTYFIVLAIAIYVTCWRLNTLENLLVGSHNISTKDINELEFRREIFKWLFGLGLITIFVNLALASRKKRGKEDNYTKEL